MRRLFFDGFVKLCAPQQQSQFGYPQGSVSSGAQRGNNEVMETVARADLLWDDEARGLCLRVYGDDSKSFVFVYRFGDRQRFIRIGTSPPCSLEAARARAKELRSILDKGRDPARENRRGKVPPVAERRSNDQDFFRQRATFEPIPVMSVGRCYDVARHSDPCFVVASE